jgi:putative ABC transport system permease protein
VVISDEMWRRRFGGDPKIAGLTIRIDEQPYEIVGVMPHGFNFPYGQRQFWTPLADSDPVTGRATMNAIARLADGLSRDAAQSRADVVSARLVADQHQPAGWKLRLGTLTASHLNPPVQRALYVLSGAVLLVLLIACANVANLLLIQGNGRRRELAVRAAIGASRGRLVRQLFVETLVLAVAGGLAGLLLAQWGVDLLAAFTPRDMTFLTTHEIALNGRVLAFALALTAVTAALFGLLPAMRVAGAGAATALGQDTRVGTPPPRAERLRRVFVLAQLTLSLMLLVGAGLLMRTFVHVARQDVGFDPRGLVGVQVSLPRSRYPTGAARQQFDRDLLARVLSTPGVLRASVEGGLPPVAGGIHFSIKPEVDGRGVVLDDPRLVLPFNSVGPDFFDLMRIPVRRGRPFTADDGERAPKVAVLSESFAARLFGSDDPIGRRLRLDAGDPWLTVVGVVGDVYQFDHQQTRDEFCLYYPRAQTSLNGPYRMLVVRAAGAPAAAVAALKQRVWDVDPRLPIQKVQTLDEAYGEFLSTPRFYAWLMGTFAAIGVLIAGVGLYGVLAYATSQRAREFGIRLALGASRADVLRLVMRSGAWMTIGGLAAGVAGSVGVTRALQSLLVDVSPVDGVTYAATTALLGAIALSAAWIPAHRAARTDPAVTLRYE